MQPILVQYYPPPASYRGHSTSPCQGRLSLPGTFPATGPRAKMSQAGPPGARNTCRQRLDTAYKRPPLAVVCTKGFFVVPGHVCIRLMKKDPEYAGGGEGGALEWGRDIRLLTGESSVVIWMGKHGSYAVKFVTPAMPIARPSQIRPPYLPFFEKCSCRIPIACRGF